MTASTHHMPELTKKTLALPCAYKLISSWICQLACIGVLFLPFVSLSCTDLDYSYFNQQGWRTYNGFQLACEPVTSQFSIALKLTFQIPFNLLSTLTGLPWSSKGTPPPFRLEWMPAYWFSFSLDVLLLWSIRGWFQEHTKTKNSVKQYLKRLAVACIFLAGFWSAWLYVANQRENRYANNLKVAYLNNRDGSFDESKQVLASSPTEFRDWEWHYLQRLNYVSPYSRWRYGQIGHHYGPRLVMSTTGSKMVLVYNPLPAEPKKPIDYRVPDQPPKITSSRIMVLDIQSGKEAFSLEVPGNAMVACDTDSSEEKLYVYQGDVIQRYRLESGQSDWSVPIENPVELDPWDTDARLELIDQGRTLVATLEKGKRLDFWDTESKQKVPPGSRPNLNRGGMRGTENDLCVVFSPDDQWIYSTATRKTINQWKAQTGERSRTFHANFVTNSDRYSNYFSALHCEGSMIETSPTGSTLLGVMDGRFSEFDLSKDETRLKTSDIDRVGFLSILEDNKLGKNYLLVNPLKRNQMREYSNTDLIQLLDAQTGKLFWEKVIPGPDRYSAADGFKKSTESLSSYLKTLNPNQIKISPNGQWIAGPLKQNAIIILNRESGRIIREIPIKQEGRFSICWTIDSKRLIHGGNDGRLHIWNPFSGIELLSIMAHPQGVTSLAVTPDGSKIVSGGKDGLIRIWDASSTY